ncbi:hypothetical protein BD410DRAFT_843127 [Rickenella mellea]|uniref:Uncharacterized protein n=1 Tax=Rickenella mellea TaxID=50990 RepID=A0A4Y7PTF4_9AGAM|nr:hypothetical protein BD410DRAFT_843127 [Rickenella mellea]
MSPRYGSATTDSIVVSSAPRLKTLHLRGDNVRVDFGEGKLDLAILDIGCSLRARNSLEYLTTIIMHCPLLTHLPIHIGTTENIPPIVPSIIELPYLCRLCVFAEIDPGALFDRLFLPALQSLQLSMVIRDGDDGEFEDWPHIKHCV